MRMFQRLPHPLQNMKSATTLTPRNAAALHQYAELGGMTPETIRDVGAETGQSLKSHAKNPKLRELRRCFAGSVSIMPRHLGEQIARVTVQRLRL
jgi:hypothetical protein